MANAQSAAVSSPVDTKLTEGFWHFGLIPASGEVYWPNQKVDPRFFTTEMEKVDAWKLYNGEYKFTDGLSIFVAKARHFTGLSVRGFHFPSTNQYVEQRNEGASMAPFLGGVRLMTNQDAKAVADSCFRHAIRYAATSRMDDPTTRVELIDLDFGRRPRGMSDENWARTQAEPWHPQAYEFNKRTDRYIAEYVYLYKLPVTVESVDMNEYLKNPNKFHYRWVPPPSKEFFNAPPKSVAESFPQGA